MTQNTTSSNCSVVPEHLSYIKPGSKEIFIQQIADILKIRFKLIQSVDLNKLSMITGRRKEDRNKDLLDLLSYRSNFLNNATCRKLSETTALQPHPMPEQQYVAMLREFLSRELFPKFLDINLKSETEYSLLKKFPELCFNHRNTQFFLELYSKTVQLGDIQSTPQERKSYFNFCKLYRMPPFNLTDLMKISAFDDETLRILKTELNTCIETLYNSLQVDQLVRDIEGKHKTAQIDIGHISVALLSAVDRLSFLRGENNVSNVLKYLQCWIYSQINDDLKEQRKAKRLAESSNPSHMIQVNVNSASLNDEQDDEEAHFEDFWVPNSELIGEDLINSRLYEEIDVSRFLATLSLETYEELLEKHKESVRNLRSFGYEKVAINFGGMFRYNYKIETQRREDDATAASVLSRAGLYTLLRNRSSVDNDTDIIERLSAKLDKIKEDFRNTNKDFKIRCVQASKDFSEFIEVVNALNMNLTKFDMKKFYASMKHKIQHI